MRIPEIPEPREFRCGRIIDRRYRTALTSIRSIIGSGAEPHLSPFQKEPVSGSAHVSKKRWTLQLVNRVHLPNHPGSIRRRMQASGTILCPPVNVAGKLYFLTLTGKKQKSRPPWCELFLGRRTGKVRIIEGLPPEWCFLACRTRLKPGVRNRTGNYSSSITLHAFLAAGKSSASAVNSVAL